MSDYELAYLFTTVTERGSTVFMDYVTILFAFLVASFFVAHQLSRKMVCIVIGAYIFAQVIILIALQSIGSSMRGLILEMNSRVLQGSESFAWFGNLDGLVNMTGWMTFLYTLPMSLIVLATIWFFFERRKLMLS